MFKKLLALFSIGFVLTSCSHLLSTKNPQATQKSKCAAIRAKMLQTNLSSNHNTPTAVSTSQDINYQKLYHEECE